MKKNFENPTIEIVEFESEDIITTSSLTMGGDSGSPESVSYSTIAPIFTQM